MKNSKLFMSIVLVSIVTVGIVASPALAWHPKGAIVKYVQGQDANTTSTAVSTAPGQVLTYSITVSNVGAADSHGYNDMVKTVMTDTLPSGVELAGSPSKRTISEDLGTLKPGQKVTKSYQIKVTAQKDGYITNKACFTGNSKANDNAQNGCDVAVIKVKTPTTPTPPTTPVTPVTPTAPTPEQPTALPQTGSISMIIPALLVSLGAYAFYLARAKRQAFFGSK
jgi:uncharacterized repeat protein (TIGR01451 family)